ncbi:MAG TPA: HEPN-associated N-terminal domain-containing protein [Fluviicoccus sp.]|nr:HEPN-associated N-terminal domain-containing protein [Fluviicoccus sp.]
MMEQERRGYWSVADKFVCPECVSDYALQEHIKACAVSKSCSYCGKKSRRQIAAKFDDLSEAILNGLRSEYGDPYNEGVPWDEGEWVGDVIDSYDAIFEKAGLDVETEELRQDILTALGDHQWCQRDFYRLSPSKALQYGWRRFSSFIKHRARFVFLNVEDAALDSMDDDHIPVSSFLAIFGSLVQRLNLVRVIPAGTWVYRLRIHDANTSLKSASELGSPPVEACVFPNRMSPAGISMFYGAFDKETCIAETYRPDGKHHNGTFGHFKNLRDLVLLDLTKVPFTPSIFEPCSRDTRHNIAFLRGFIGDITMPVQKDGREHIEYVPTQVVSEYVRHVLKIGDKPLDGIVYLSSRERGSAACVLFFDNEACVDSVHGTGGEELHLYKVSHDSFCADKA